jgi:amino acid adenylation domain-containing protein
MNKDTLVFPVSYAQERLWFLDQLEPGSPAYNVVAAYRLTGPLDVDALEQALQEVVRRHEALRTTFTAVDGQPVQVIHSQLQRHSDGALAVVDLAHLERHSDGAEAEARRLMGLERRAAFNLEEGPLLRASLLRLGAEEHILLLSVHHIVTDGWSMGILRRELSALYHAFSKGQPSPLPELAIQYADYATWQREWLQGQVLEAQLAYWLAHLHPLPPALDLPADHQRPPIQTFHGSTRTFCIPQALTGACKALARREQATLFMTLLAAFQILLYRYSGREDIVVGTPIANRTRPEVGPLIGFLANTLVLSTDLSGNPTFRQLLGRVRHVCLDAYDHQDLPFEKLVEQLNPARDLSRNPLVQVMFALGNMPQHDLVLPGLTVRTLRAGGASAKFDLTLQLAEADGSLRGSVEYSTDLFDDGTIARMMGHFVELLEGIVQDPDRQIGGLPLLTPAEKHQLLVEWNATATGYPRDSSLDKLFEAQVEARPDALAVVYGRESLTYRELYRRAARLAQWLQSRGVGPEVLVGVYMEPSIELVVTLLAIIKAGGAYLPLDTKYPADRVAFMLEDGRVSIVLTQDHLMERLPAEAAQVFCPGGIDYAGSAPLTYPAAVSRSSQATPDNLAYVIYTSGSTGRPKGVSIPRRAITRLVLHTNYVQLGPTDRIGQASNVSFDAATFEIWGALLNGAQLIGIPEEVLLSPLDLMAEIDRQQISVMFLTTALFNQTANTAPNAFHGLDTLMFGGEASDPASVRQVLEHGPPRRLLNVYGPTESTTFTTWHLVQRVGDDARTVPIGRPISNTQVYILDSRLQAVPVGIPGQLYIGGDGLARSYLRRPGLTAETFVPHPFSQQPGDRLYATGDLARYLPDGSIEFLGRQDRQVKLRGFRVELGEIEAVLSRHPAVREGVVLLREEAPNDKRLVAYLVPSQGLPEPGRDDLVGFLRQYLPDYMTPSAFVFLPSLPLTANRKVDWGALPAPDTSRPQLAQGFVAPRTPLQEAIAEIWAEVLGLERVGIDDSFFDLGGHSLLATQIISRLRTILRVDIPLRTLFDRPTVAGLAKAIEQSGEAGEGADSEPISPLPRRVRRGQAAAPDDPTAPGEADQQR